MPDTTIYGCYSFGVNIEEIEEAIKHAKRTSAGKKLLRAACADIRGDKVGRPQVLVTCPKCKERVTASALKNFRKCPHTEDTVTPRA